MKEILDKLGFSELNTSCLWKTVLREWEFKPHTGRKYLQKKNPIYDKGLLLKTYEELLKFNNKESKQQVLNGLNS